jgi:diguanylate cyclase (GGDEF)-like protein
MTHTGATTPVDEAELPATVRRAFWQVTAAAVLLTLMSAGLFGWIVFHQQPQVTTYRKALVSALQGHQAMLAQETALRAYLSTADPSFLEPYRRARADLVVANRGLHRLSDDRRASPMIVALEVSQRRWQDGWATFAADPASRSTLTSAQALGAFVDRGRTLFGDYRRNYDAFEASLSTTMNRARSEENATMAATGIAEVAVAVAMILLAWRRRRQVGDYALRREQAALAQSHRLRQVLTLAREVAGSLNLGYVLQAVAETTRAVGGFDEVVVWLLDEEARALIPAHDTAGRVNDAPSGARVDVGTGLIGRAAAQARVLPSNDPDRPAIALPMIVGARVVGVVEGIGQGDDIATDSLEVLEMLSVHAATAIEAARLHGRTTELSLIDPLTGLANRRRLDDDMALEVDRALRYGRPLALLMLDLDHFKRLNDTYGHQRGDSALQEAAQTIRADLRSTDVAYRYGGEEIAVLVRDSFVPAAAQLAERLRAHIEQVFSGPAGLHVTASIGVAGLPEHATDAAGLVAAADTALYAAKRAGRNRVLLADPAPAPLSPHHPQ